MSGSGSKLSRYRFPPLADPNEPPRQLRLNYKTETGGFVKVELITHRPQAAPVGLADCHEGV